MFQIDLTTDGDLLLYMPTNRTVIISASAEGLAFIKKVILDHRRGLRNQLGYIGTLPTQHAVDKAFADQFLAEKRAKQAKEKVEAFQEKTGIDLGRLEINI